MTASADTAGVIAPPPLIYIGFLLLGWGLLQLAAAPAVAAAIGPDAAGWIGLGFGLETQTRRLVAVDGHLGGMLR
jgi:hypothetical protein